jgi:ATP-dependent Lhr-like helicase
VRRGYFVQGLPGVQFALPEAVERLREWSRAEGLGSEQVPLGESAEGLVLVNACDPANLFGPALAGEEDTPGVATRSQAASSEAGRPLDPARFTRIPANHVVLLRGQPLLLLETGGERVIASPGLSAETLRQALKLAIEHAGSAPRRLTLSEWNGEPILDSPAGPVLEGLGFRREALVYVWEG